MTTIKKIFSRLFPIATSEKSEFYREWDELRSKALSPSEVAEIDAIFSRAA